MCYLNKTVSIVLEHLPLSVHWLRHHRHIVARAVQYTLIIGVVIGDMSNQTERAQ